MADGDLLTEESDRAAGGDILSGALQVSTTLNSERGHIAEKRHGTP